MLRRSLVCAIALVSAACSSTPMPAGPGGEGGGGGAATGAEEARYSFTFTTAPGKETHYCQYMKMPASTSGDVLVTGYTWQWQNMHHWGLFRTTSDLPANVSFTEPFDCFAPGAMQYAAPAALELRGGESGDALYPEGTGFAFKPGEIVLFQAHTINTTSADVKPTIDLTVKVGDPAKTPHRLGLIQFYDPYIFVPAHAKAKAQMRCAIPQDITIVESTTHEHIRGTGVTVTLEGPDGTAAPKPLVTSTDWQHPTTVDETHVVKKGSYIRTVCDYQGDDRDVIQGQDKQDNEMCMYVAYYYPAVDDGGLFENCIQTPVPGGVGDSYGTGAKSCTESLACIQACSPADAPVPGDGRIDVGACWQKCLVDSCPSAAAPLNALGGCVSEKCATECSGGDCAACVVKNCAAEYGSCQSDGC